MGGGMISFAPGALSGMGWLRTKNVHAQHACDHNRFSSIPATEEKKKKRNGGERRKKKKGTETFTFSLQVHPRRRETSRSTRRVPVFVCVCMRERAPQISVLVRPLFVILFFMRTRVRACVCVCWRARVYSVSKLEGCN